MPYIYKITNKINGKIYIGKTLNTIEKRWKEHCSDYKRERCEKRPLYNAMNKYGIENFEISLVEECDENILSEREKYWIEYYGAFKYGYNATIGGDGKPYADYDLFFALFKQGKNIKEISQITGFCTDTVSLGLKNKEITHEEIKNNGRMVVCKKIAKIDKDTDEILSVYSSIQEAYNELNKQHSGHIASVCNGKRKTAYGYKWKYI